MNVVVANRDPTEKDPGYCHLWWNKEKNRFFLFDSTNELLGIYAWIYLKEKE